MVQGQFNFDRDAYLQARPDVGRAGVDPYQHYLQHGKNEGMDQYNIFNQSIKQPDPEISFTYDNEGGRTAKTNFFDPNEYSSIGRFTPRNDESGQYDFQKAEGDFRGLKFAGEMADENGNLKAMYENEDGLGYTFDFNNNSWEGNQYNYDNLQRLKKEDPNQYYRKVGENYRDEFFNNWKYNRSEANAGMAKLEKLKETNPYAYYVNKIDAEAKQAGWNYGQNRADRAEPSINKIRELAPEAIKAGISPQELDEMVNRSINAASVENQQFIQNRKNSGFNLGELARGIAPVVALAVGAPFLDAALFGATAAGSAGGFGLTGAAGATKAGATGGLLGAGSASGIAASNAAMGLGLGTGAGAAGAGFGGLSAALPAGTMLGTGLNGGAIGATYLAAGPGQIAKSVLGAPILYDGSSDLTQLAKNLYETYNSSKSAKDKAQQISDLLKKQGQSAQTRTASSGGNNSNIAAILNSNANLERSAARLRAGNKPFLTEASEIIVDPDKLRQQARKPKNFGLADILQNMENYG